MNSLENLQQLFAEYYGDADDSDEKFRLQVEEWIRLWRGRLRLSLQLEWLRALKGVPGGPDSGTVTGRLDAIKKTFQGVIDRIIDEIPALLEQVRRLEADLQAESRDLPDIGPGPAYTPEQAAILLLALSHQTIGRQSSLPELTERARTGVGGKSTLLFLPFANLGERRVIAAKFDVPERAEQEWKQIDHLRRLTLPEGIILPLERNQWGDGVILSQAAVTHHSGNCITLLEYLKKSLAVALPNCKLCLHLAARVLANLYRLEPGGIPPPQKGPPRRWQDFTLVSEVSGAWGEIRKAAQGWLGTRTDWAEESPIPDPRPEAAQLPDPFADNRKAELIEAPVRDVYLSRVHGDLNLTNLLVQESRDRTPEKIYVIDLARCKDDQPTAADFARLEAEICFRAFADDAFAGSVPKEGERDFLDCVDFADGRAGSLPDRLQKPLKATAHLLVHLRHLAWKQLNAQPAEDYVLTDYFQCLYFTYLWYLRFRLEPREVRLAVLGAASSLRTLHDIRDVRYSPGADDRFGRPWENGTPPGA